MPPIARPERRHPLHRRGPRGSGSGQDVWLYGLHPVIAALANPSRSVRRVVATAGTQEALATAAAAAPVSRPAVETVDGRTLDQLLPTAAVHQGAAALVDPLAALDLHEILAAAGSRSCLVVLDQVTDPRNVGAVLRAAAAFAADAVVVQDRHAPEATGALAKAAAGALETVPLVRVTNIARALRAAQESGFRCAGLDGDAPLDLAAADLTGPVALVLGSEGGGLRRLVTDTCDLHVRIPIAAAIESLNIATAAAVALYEVRRAPPPPA